MSNYLNFKKVVIFYTRKVVLWCFFTSEMSKILQFSFLCQNLSIERNFLQTRWKSNQDMTPTFPYNLKKIVFSRNNYFYIHSCLIFWSHRIHGSKLFFLFPVVAQLRIIVLVSSNSLKKCFCTIFSFLEHCNFYYYFKNGRF